MVRTFHIAVIFALALSACRNADERAVATVEDEEITVGEFRERFQLFLNASGVRDTYESRRQVINNMVNEKLVLADLRSRGWYEKAEVKTRLSEIENQALLDAFAKDEIYDTVTVSEQELQEEFRAWNTKTSARYLYAETEDGALELKHRLERGEAFEKLAREVFRDPGLAANGGSVGFFGKGEMEPAFENAAAALKVGETSGPVKIGVGYALIRVDQRKVVPLLSETDYAKKKADLESAIRERKNAEALREVVRRIGKELDPRFNDELVRAVGVAWDSLSKPRLAETAIPTGQTVMWQDSVLVRFSTGTWTAGDFVGRIQDLTLRQRDAVRTDLDLKNAVTGLAARDVLLERARVAGLDERPDVRKQISSVTLQYALKEWARAIEDSVRLIPANEGLILRVFRENLDRFVVPPQINVAEILVRTKAEASELLASVRGGADFAGLARKRSIRLWAAKQAGELGFKTAAEYGPLGEKFQQARVGEVIGPEYIDPYYGIFKILARRPGRTMTQAEARPQIEEGIVRQQTSDAVRRTVESLRGQYTFFIDDPMLQNIPLVNHDS